MSEKKERYEMITIIHYEKSPNRTALPQFHVEELVEAFSLLSIMEKAGIKQVKIYWNNIPVSKKFDHQLQGYNFMIIEHDEQFDYDN